MQVDDVVTLGVSTFPDRGPDGRGDWRYLYIVGMPDPIYLDHAATTPVRTEVFEAMLRHSTALALETPSSMHRWGRERRG